MDEHDEHFDDEPRPEKQGFDFARGCGVVTAWVLVAGGLALVGFIVLVLVGLNQWSSNK